MTTEILFVILTLVAVILFKNYDSIRHRWQSKKTNGLSLLWHSMGLALLVYVSALIYYHFFSLTLAGWKAALWLSVISWWLVDMIWNKINGQQLFYAGDGTGSFTEIILKWIAVKIGTTLVSSTIMAKLLATLLAAILTTLL